MRIIMQVQEQNIIFHTTEAISLLQNEEARLDFNTGLFQRKPCQQSSNNVDLREKMLTLFKQLNENVGKIMKKLHMLTHTER